ncbi:hypothetical protein D9T11_25240 [Enterobacter kobei]|nr:hypothetical protein D9T11_25240 [Enterobacter kobei]
MVVCFFLAIDQIAQSGLSSPKVIYYLERLFRMSVSRRSLSLSCPETGLCNDGSSIESHRK